MSDKLKFPPIQCRLCGTGVQYKAKLYWHTTTRKHRFSAMEKKVDPCDINNFDIKCFDEEDKIPLFNMVEELLILVKDRLEHPEKYKDEDGNYSTSTKPKFNDDENKNKNKNKVKIVIQRSSPIKTKSPVIKIESSKCILS